MTDEETITRDTLPSMKRKLREDAAAKRRKALAAEEKDLRRAFGVVFSTAEGQRVLDWLRVRCLHHETALAVTPGTLGIDTQLTLYRAMQQAVYLDMRKYIPKRALMEIEYGR